LDVNAVFTMQQTITASHSVITVHAVFVPARGAGSKLKVDGHYFQREAPEIFYCAPTFLQCLSSWGHCAHQPWGQNDVHL